jgi:hypothetical protein
MPHSDPTPISPDQVERLVAALRATRTELWHLLEEVGANRIAEMTPAQLIRAMSLLQQRRAGGGLNTDQRRPA